MRTSAIAFSLLSGFSIFLVAIVLHNGNFYAQHSVLDSEGDVQYFYLPADVVKKAETGMKRRNFEYSKVIQQSLESSGKGAARNCAISSLVEQANAIFPQWDGCGYMHASTTFSTPSSGGVVTGPSDDTLCGPDDVEIWPCNEKFGRKFENDNPGNLAHCYQMIKGLTETCDFYDKCGPRMYASEGATSVCSSPTGDYYKEPEVQRMCGICRMARTELLNAQEVDDNGGGCLADDAVAVRRSEEHGGLREEQVAIKDLNVGDLVRAPDASGKVAWRPVYYVMAHKEAMPLVELQWRGGSLTISNNHFVPVHREGPGGYEGIESHKTARASDISVGDSIFVLEAGGRYQPVPVTGVRTSRGRARYVLVEGGRVEVGARGGEVGAAATVYSTALGELETLPFLFLHSLLPGSLQVPAIARSLELALESPLLMAIERALVQLEKIVVGRKKMESAQGREQDRRRGTFNMLFFSHTSSSHHFS